MRTVTGGMTSRAAGRIAVTHARYITALRGVGPAPVVVTVRERLQIHVAHARTLRDAGDYAGAEDCLRRGIAETESALGTHAVELAVPLNELGIVGKYQGNFGDAEQLYQRALAIHERHGTAAGTEAAAILHNLAGLAHARADPHTAEPLARRGIALRETPADRTVEDTNADAETLALAADRSALAAILIDLGQLAEARTMLTEVLHTYRTTLGPDHYEVGVTLHNLGSLEYREGRPAAAARTLRRAHAVKQAALGTRHPDLAVTLHSLACCLQELGATAAAERCLQDAVDILAGAVTETEPTLAACRQQLDQLHPPA
jgi:tetratricopeptide (TPR) repeat protein